MPAPAEPPAPTELRSQAERASRRDDLRSVDRALLRDLYHVLVRPARSGDPPGLQRR